MEALDPDTLAWGKRIGISPERLAFLAACPKYTRTGRNDKPAYIKTEILHNLGKDLETARRHRDEMLAAYDAGKPIPHLQTK